MTDGRVDNVYPVVSTKPGQKEGFVCVGEVGGGGVVYGPGPHLQPCPTGERLLEETAGAATGPVCA